MTNTNASRDRRWLGLFAILAAMIMNILDSTIVNVAAPSIRDDLGGSYTSLQWISAAYTLALAVGLLTGGRLGDLFGRRRMLMAGATGFVLASLSCGLAVSPAMLIGSRAVQGLFGALMVPQAFGLIRDLFPPREIGKAFGAFGPIIGLSTILGPVVAGVLIDADILGTGWRMVFLINLLLGGFAILAGRASLPIARGSRQGGLDVQGALIAGAGMLMVVYPLVQGREQGWPAWMVALPIAALAVFGAFIYQQRNRRRGGRAPLVQLSVFAKRSYSSGVAFVIIFFGSIVGFSLSVGLFLQLGEGLTPMRASLTMLGWAVGAFLGSGFGATMMARLGRRILHLGLALMIVGLTGVAWIFSTATGSVNGWGLALPLVVYGFGMGMIFVPLFDIIMGDIRDHEVGSAASILESLQQLGSSLGVAVLGTVFFSLVGIRPLLGDFLHASRQIALIAIGLTVMAFVVGFALPKRARAAYRPEDERQTAETPDLVNA